MRGTLDIEGTNDVFAFFNIKGTGVCWIFFTQRSFIDNPLVWGGLILSASMLYLAFRPAYKSEASNLLSFP